MLSGRMPTSPGQHRPPGTQPPPGEQEPRDYCCRELGWVSQAELSCGIRRPPGAWSPPCWCSEVVHQAQVSPDK